MFQRINLETSLQFNEHLIFSMIHSTESLIIQKTDDPYTKLYKLVTNIFTLSGAIFLGNIATIVMVFQLTILKFFQFFVPKNMEGNFFNHELSKSIEKMALINISTTQALARYFSIYMSKDRRKKIDRSIERSILNFYYSESLIGFYRLHLNGMSPQTKSIEKKEELDEGWIPLSSSQKKEEKKANRFTSSLKDSIENFFFIPSEKA